MILHFWQSQPRINLTLSSFPILLPAEAELRDTHVTYRVWYLYFNITSIVHSRLSKVSDDFGSILSWSQSQVWYYYLLYFLLSTFLHSECAKLGDYLAAENYIGLMCADKLRLSKSELFIKSPSTGSGGRWGRRQSYKWRARPARRATSAAQSATPCVLSCDNYTVIQLLKYRIHYVPTYRLTFTHSVIVYISESTPCHVTQYFHSVAATPTISIPRCPSVHFVWGRAAAESGAAMSTHNKNITTITRESSTPAPSSMGWGEQREDNRHHWPGLLISGAGDTQLPDTRRRLRTLD